jgi:hypothetical protein
MPAVRFTPEEIKALVDSGQLQPADVRAMHPEDQKVWLGYAAEQEKAGAEHPGVGEGSARTVAAEMAANPGKAAGLAAAAAVPVAAGGVMPALGAALRYMPAAGRYAAGGAGMALGAEGANAIGSALGLPRPITNILSMIGGMAGGHFGMGSGPSLAAEEGFAGRKPVSVGEVPDSFQGIPVEKIRASGVGPDTVNRNVYSTPHGPDLPQPPGFNMFGAPPESPSMPSNVERVPTRAAFDEIGRTPAGPKPKPRFSPNEQQSAQELEELLNRTGRERPNPMGQGTMPDSNLRTQPNISLKRTYEDLANTTRGGVQVEGATTDLFNKDGALDESRLKRLFEQMDAKKEPAVKPRKRTPK